MLTLKGYQQTALTSLENFLAQAKLTNDFTGAFEQHRQEGLHERYQHHEGLGHIPHVCLRIPTGGGKTLLAAHAVKRTARSYMEKDFPVVLWLVPSDAIRQQTVAALKPGHPYYEALYSDFNDRIGVYDIADSREFVPRT